MKVSSVFVWPSPIFVTSSNKKFFKSHYLSTYLHIYISIYQYINISIYQYINISIHQYINICISIYVTEVAFPVLALHLFALLARYHCSSPCKLSGSELQRTLLSVELRIRSFCNRFASMFLVFSKLCVSSNKHSS